VVKCVRARGETGFNRTREDVMKRRPTIVLVSILSSAVSMSAMAQDQPPPPPSPPPAAPTPPPEAQPTEPPAPPPGAEPAPAATEATPAPAAEPAPQGPVEQITVTGSAIRRRDLATPAPVSILDRLDIDASGFSSLGQILQNIPEQSNGINVQFN